MDDAQYFELLESLLDEGRDVTMTPKGNSMLPFIKGGKDSVKLTVPKAPLEVGDIVLAKVGERFIMHRVFAVDGDALTLMGDGNIAGKEHCSTSDVMGLVTEIHKKGDRVVIPGKARLWRFLRPVRRYILAVYKRVFL